MDVSSGRGPNASNDLGEPPDDGPWEDARGGISPLVLIAAAIGVAVLVATAGLLLTFKAVTAAPVASRPPLLAVAVGATPSPTPRTSPRPTRSPRVKQPKVVPTRTPTASPKPSGRPAPTRRPRPTPRPRDEVSASRSLNWGGHSLHGQGFTFVSARWVHPVVRCAVARPAVVGFWIGLDGATSDTVEQIGTGATCRLGSTPRHYAWWEMYPDELIEIDLVVRPGDTIEAQVEARGTTFTLSLWNRTSGRSFETVQVLPSARRSSAEWIVEPITYCKTDDHCEIAALPSFDPVTFTDATVRTSGQATSIGSAGGELFRTDIESEDGELLATTSALGRDGRSFTVTWRDDGGS